MRFFPPKWTPRNPLCPNQAGIIALPAASLLLALVAYAQSGDGAPPAMGENVTGDLRVAHAIWSKYEGGPPLQAPVSFDPGELVAFRARLAGFRMAEVEFQRYRVFLTYEISAFDFRGIPIGETRKDIINEAIHQEDKDWLPAIQHTLFLPPLAEFGDYEIRIRVRDEISQRQASFTLPFRVNGKQLPSLSSVSVLNFGFYRAEADRSPMPEGVYRPGNTLWARFDVAGFRIEEKNRFQVVCDVQVKNESGAVLFEQPEALREDASPEYPRRYVPGVFSLAIKPGTPKGRYFIAVIARDLLSDETAEESFPFSIE